MEHRPVRYVSGSYTIKIFKCNNQGLMNGKTVSVLKKYHRWILWIILGLLYLFDIITTLIGVQNGGHEQSPLLLPYVDNPLFLLGIKIFIFFLLFIPLEAVIFLLNMIPYDENSSAIARLFYGIFYYFPYGMCIFLIICVIVFYSIVQVNNLEFIFFHQSLL